MRGIKRISYWAVTILVGKVRRYRFDMIFTIVDVTAWHSKQAHIAANNCSPIFYPGAWKGILSILSWFNAVFAF